LDRAVEQGADSSTLADFRVEIGSAAKRTVAANDHSGECTPDYCAGEIAFSERPIAARSTSKKNISTLAERTSTSKACPFHSALRGHENAL
jgi:hypothetical protein